MQTFEIKLEARDTYDILAFIPNKSQVKIRNLGSVPVRVSSVEEQLNEGWVLFTSEILEIKKEDAEARLYAKLNNGGYTVLSIAYTVET